MVRIEPPPAFSSSGSAGRAQATSEYALTSRASQKRSRGVSVKRPSRSSAAAKATECTSRSRPPPNASPTSRKTRAMSSSERTSHAVTSGLSTWAARSRTFDSIRSPWNVNASRAPPAASRCAIAQAIERLFATPRISPVFPSKSTRRPYETSATFGFLRRALVLAVLAALVAVPAASAAFHPIRRDFGELTSPRVRAGKMTIPSGQQDGRLRVIVSLKLPPLAQAYGRGLYAAGAAHRLQVRSSAAKAYVARIDAQQNAAIAQLRRALPDARVSLRYQVVLNAFAVSLPAKELPKLSRQGFAARVWPSFTYHLALNRSPAVIGADVFHAATGGNGEGVKIGVVDDGVDNTNPFLSGAGFTAPTGFPLGQTKFTNGKIIVARAFAGPGSGAAGKLPLDRKSSFHGTHVAGIAAGDATTCAPAGDDHPPECGPSGIAPKAFIGNYRVFNVPSP